MIKKMLEMYNEPIVGETHHSNQSWNNCYRYFKDNHTDLHDEVVQDIAALHIGFLLASWDMMHGSSKLRRHDYRIHLDFVKHITADTKYHYYYTDQGRGMLKEEDIQSVMDLIEATKLCYEPHFKVTDTLVTTILLGVFGCVSAYDRCMIKGLRLNGLSGSVTPKSLKQLICFYNAHEQEFSPFLKDDYTAMRLLNIYLWQSGQWEAEAIAIEMKERTEEKAVELVKAR